MPCGTILGKDPKQVDISQTQSSWVKLFLTVPVNKANRGIITKIFTEYKMADKKHVNFNIRFEVVPAKPENVIPLVATTEMFNKSMYCYCKI